MAREYEYGEVPYSFESRPSGFSVGTVLSRSFSALCKHPFVFIGLSLLAQIPGILIAFLAVSSMRPAILPVSMRIMQVVNAVFGLVIQGAVTYGVYETFLGRGARFGASMSRGLARVISLILAVLCSFIFMALIGILMAMGAWILGPLAIVVLIIGLVVMAALWCKWSVFVPSCVVERLGPIECLNRSSELTKGRRLKIFGLSLLCFVIIFVFAFIIKFMLGTYILTLIRTVGPMAGVIIYIAVDQLITVIPATFFHIVSAASYYGLREDKEGVSIEHLTNVFD